MGGANYSSHQCHASACEMVPDWPTPVPTPVPTWEPYFDPTMYRCDNACANDEHEPCFKHLGYVPSDCQCDPGSDGSLPFADTPGTPGEPPRWHCANVYGSISCCGEDETELAFVTH